MVVVPAGKLGLIVWGAELAFPTLATVVTPIIYGAISGAIAYGGYRAVKALNEADIAKNSQATSLLRSEPIDLRSYNKSKTETKEGSDKQRKGKPGPNHAQNKQFDDAIKNIEKKIQRKLSKDQRELLHREISGKDYSYKDIIDEGVGMFNNYY